VKAEILRKIPVVAKPNRKLTEAEKIVAEKRARQVAKEEREKKAGTNSGLSRVFSFLRPAQ
ncbi:MAG: hypothetical protein ACKOEI_11530, partial [Chthoniobacterales bacterium]